MGKSVKNVAVAGGVTLGCAFGSFPGGWSGSATCTSDRPTASIWDYVNTLGAIATAGEFSGATRAAAASADATEATVGGIRGALSKASSMLRRSRRSTADVADSTAPAAPAARTAPTAEAAQAEGVVAREVTSDAPVSTARPAKAAGGATAKSPPTTLYHGTSAENAASIRATGIDVSRGNPMTDFGQGSYTTTNYDQALARAGGDHAGALAFDVPEGALDGLSGRTFAESGDDFASFVRGLRTGEANLYDYVTGPVLRNIRPFYRGEAPDTFGDQTAFHTERAAQTLFDTLR